MQRRLLAGGIAAGLAVTAGLALPADGAMPGQDGRISYVKFLPEGGAEVYAIDADGSDEAALTDSGGGIAVNSDWRPDGQRFAFDSDRDATPEAFSVDVYTAAADGSDVRRVTAGGGFTGWPAHTPDGGQLVVESDWGDFPAAEGLYVLDAGGSDQTREDARQLTSNTRGGFDFAPEVSPDGTWLTFTRSRTDCSFRTRGRLQDVPRRCVTAIFRIGLDGTGLRQLTPWGQDASAADISPDGTTVVYDTGDKAGPGDQLELWAVGADGSGRRQLTDNPPVRQPDPEQGASGDQNPAFSPSGERIVFTRFRQGEAPVLQSIAPDGSGRASLPGAVDANFADWGTAPPVP